MPSAPRISVVMTVYNGARLVAESIESVLGQTFADFEFVIVDDGSTDDMPAVLATHAWRDTRISVHTQPRNLGFREALNWVAASRARLSRDWTRTTSRCLIDSNARSPSSTGIGRGGRRHRGPARRRARRPRRRQVVSDRPTCRVVNAVLQ
jgi:hypothetical protein